MRFGAEQIGLCCRDQLAAQVAKLTKDFPVNIIKKEADRLLFVNGRLSEFGDLPALVEQARQSCIYRTQDGSEIVAVLLRSESLAPLPAVTTPSNYQQFVSSQMDNLPSFNSTAAMYRYCWDFVDSARMEIIRDFETIEPTLKPARRVKVHDGAFFVNGEHIHLTDGVEVLPTAVLDATNGPIFIGPETKIEAQAAIYGPCYIGPNCRILAGKITASSIGNSCRVGGEVEESVFQSYVNKYHDGFIGHSYVGAWVNFGAMTTNSDLKNNYSNIRVTLNGESLDSGTINVGSFIGDHTKFGIGTLLNTGINIGSCCNLFGGGLIADKEIESFSWGDGKSYVPYEFDKAIETAKTVAERRGEPLESFEVEILRAVSKGNYSHEGVLDFS